MQKLKKIMIPVDIVLGVLIVALIALTIVVNVSADKSEDSVSFKVDNDSTETGGSSSYSVEFEKEMDDFSTKADVAGSATTTSKMDDATAYIIDNSADVELTAADIATLTDTERTYAAYEIEARHGKVFDDATVQAYFIGKVWYTQDTAYNAETLSEIEKKNIALLTSTTTTTN